LLAFLLLVLAATATAAPVTLPSPIPISVPSNAPFTFHQQTWAEQHPFFIQSVEVLFLIATIGIIGLMAVQTTKTEGLSGSIGGRAESAYRGRIGFEQQLTRLTSATALAWIILAMIYFFVTR